MIKKTFHITDMHCSSCPMRLEGIEDILPGIRNIRASYQKQNMEVEFDENSVTEQQILDAIKKLGYTVG
jgi:copper chaperone CopZ